LFGLKIGFVQTGPFAPAFIPPDVFLSIRPGAAFRIRGSAVVQNPPVVRPREPPVRARIVTRGALAVTRAVMAFLGEDAAINPASARRAAIIFQFGKALDEFAAGYCISVNLLQNLGGVGLIFDPASAPVWKQREFLIPVIPREILQSGIAGSGGTRKRSSQPPADVVQEPQIRPAVPRRIDGLIVPLQQPLRVGQRALFFGRGRRRQEKNFRPYSLRVDAFRSLVPEAGA